MLQSWERDGVSQRTALGMDAADTLWRQTDSINAPERRRAASRVSVMHALYCTLASAAEIGDVDGTSVQFSHSVPDQANVSRRVAHLARDLDDRRRFEVEANRESARSQPTVGRYERYDAAARRTVQYLAVAFAVRESGFGLEPEAP